ncbi:MAG: hypothetical protein P4L84_32950, partial [Isosphaeraceae bacterium]|nr:hypothetical protein [Isosphaeraceae bacterium]
ERILFFPGFKTEMTHVRGFRGEELKFDRPFAFDHASLEQRRDTWHITTARSKDHEGRPAATDLGDGRVLWFGMSLASTDVLRELKRDTVATFAVPERSSKWKGEQFIQSRQGKEFPGVYLPERPGTAEDLCFPLISVIVGPTGFEIYRGPIWGWPYGSVFATEEPSEQVRFRTRHQRFRLDEQTDVQLTAMWGLGSLAIPAIFTSPIVRAIEPNADS